MRLRCRMRQKIFSFLKMDIFRWRNTAVQYSVVNISFFMNKNGTRWFESVLAKQRKEEWWVKGPMIAPWLSTSTEPFKGTFKGKGSRIVKRFQISEGPVEPYTGILFCVWYTDFTSSSIRKCCTLYLYIFLTKVAQCTWLLDIGIYIFLYFWKVVFSSPQLSREAKYFLNKESFA